MDSLGLERGGHTMVTGFLCRGLEAAIDGRQSFQFRNYLGRVFLRSVNGTLIMQPNATNRTRTHQAEDLLTVWFLLDLQRLFDIRDHVATV